jgi:hypothetical protein
MRIQISSKELNSRNKTIKQFLKPIARDYQDLYVGSTGSSTTQYIASAKDNSSTTTGRYDDMRFRTVIPSLRAMYYERWYRIDKGKGKFYYLDRAYLHIYMIEPALAEEKEFCLLHCDPNEPDNAAHAKYKQSLHLHIECTDSSCSPHCHIWPHAHIALNTGYLNHVLRDVNSLTQAIEEAVLMLREEVLDLFLQLR